MDHYKGDGVAANGFGRYWLFVAEVHALWTAGYPVPPNMCCPSGWVLNAGGLSVPPLPTGAARQAAIYDHYWGEQTQEERNDPRWDPENHYGWSLFFQC
jgi:hypothetical protein